MSCPCSILYPKKTNTHHLRFITFKLTPQFQPSLPGMASGSADKPAATMEADKISDRGVQFTSRTWHAFCKRLNVYKWIPTFYSESPPVLQEALAVIHGSSRDLGSSLCHHFTKGGHASYNITPPGWGGNLSSLITQEFPWSTKTRPSPSANPQQKLSYTVMNWYKVPTESYGILL